MEIKRKRIAVYGGSFNPVHSGHIDLATHILYNDIADEVLFMPVADPPHKSASDLAPYEFRVAMISAAIKEFEDSPDGCVWSDQLHCSTLESKLPKPSYTLNTLDHLAHDMLDAEFAWVIGADELNQLHTWAPDPIRLVRNYDFIIYLRKDVSVDLVALNQHWPGWLCQKLLNSIVFDANIFPVSASEIRACIRGGKPYNELWLPTSVKSFIEDNKLYKDDLYA